MPAATTTPSAFSVQSPRLDRLDDSLNGLAQTRSCSTRVDRDLEAPVHVDVIGQIDLLDVDLVGDQSEERTQTLGIRRRNRDLGQRKTNSQILCLAQAQHRGAHGPDVVHRRYQVGVRGELRRLRPISQVNRALPGQPAPDHLGHQGQQRRSETRHDLEHGVKGVDRVAILVPEPRTRPSHIPVGERITEQPKLVARAGDVVDLEGLGDHVAGGSELGQDVLIEDVLRIGTPHTGFRGGTTAGSSRRSTAGAMPDAHLRGCPARSR